jgi:RND family efflux transporter MFP subunit
MPPNSSDMLRHTPPRGLKLIGLVALAVAASVVVLGVISRVRADQGARAWTQAQAVATVTLVTAKADTAPSTLTLPAQLQAYESAGIHSRVSGYLKDWKVDIGTAVKKGQLLAEVDTPDLDQQLLQARADLATARANQALSQSTEARWKTLLAKDAVSQQEYDEKAGDLAAKTSLVAAAEANVNRLQATAAFKRVLAPFDGVVTQRTTDIGQLVTAGAGDPLYTVADVHRLRIYVHVPQSYTTQVRPGMTVNLRAPERPSQLFKAQVVNDAQAIAGQSGTLLVQLQIDNASGELKPGEYVQADFTLANGADIMTLPATALIYDGKGTHVALAGPDGRVILRDVILGRDLGTRVQVASGITPNDRVIDNPPDAIANGDPVKVADTGGAGDRG